MQIRLMLQGRRRKREMLCSKLANMQGPPRDMRRYDNAAASSFPFLLVWNLNKSFLIFFLSVYTFLLKQAAKFIEYDSSFSEEEKQLSKVLKVTCNLNNAACKLKLKDYKEAEKLCSKVYFSVSCYSI